MELLQDKWFGSNVEGNIQIKEQIYTLKMTGNKRQLFYYNNKVVNTIPYFINENKT